MGKTKIKTVDDSVEEPQKKAPKEPRSTKATRDKEDALVAKLNAELGIEETTGSVIASVGRDSADLQSEAILKIKESDQAKQSKQAKPRSERSSRIRGKKYREVSRDLDRTKFYPLPEALDMVKKMSYAKFNGKTSGSLEAHINTAQTGIHGLVSLPYASGKKLRILAFGKGAESSGADIFGTDSTIDEMTAGKIDFDLILTTPEWMPKLAKVARVLGPKGIMPNPKNGTITDPSADGLKKAVESFQAGKTEFKTEAKAPVMHIALGKLNQPNEELAANIKILLSSIGKSKIKKVTLAPTMGPSIKLDLASI